MTSAAPAQAPSAALAPMLAYGAYGLPLSFLALPIYILLPDHIARTTGLGLAMIGVILLCTRLADALWDPWIGRSLDRYAPRWGYHGPIALATPLMCAGFAALFLWPYAGTWAVPQLVLVLLCTFFAFSTASIAYQAWGAHLARAEQGRAAIVGVREAFALIGMVMAAALPPYLGFAQLSLLLALLFVLSLIFLWGRAPRVQFAPAGAPETGWQLPLRRPAFVWLFGIFLCNGMASAITATLMPFFVRDALQAEPWFALYLATYLGASALGIAFWVRWAGRKGLLHAWRWGMMLAVVSFLWVLLLPNATADVRHIGFMLICIISGIAMGADLVAPSALLAGIIQRAGDDSTQSASYFGLWNFGAKLTLALAAGLALPLLSALDYVPGTLDPSVQGLIFTYAILPCALKLLAFAMLWAKGPLLAGDRL